MRSNRLLIFAYLTIFVFVFFNCSSTYYNGISQSKYKLPYYDSLPHLYKVDRIKSINEIAYAIDLIDEAKKYRYTIISLKGEKIQNLKIKKGKEYLFILFPYYDYSSKDARNKEVYIMGDPYFIIELENYKFRFIGDKKTGHIVTSPNLKGLYYIGNISN